MKKIFIGLCIVGMSIGSVYAGCGKMSEGIWNCDGYTIEVSGVTSGNVLKVRGRVSDGKTCLNLRISATLKSKSGNTENVYFTVSNVGPGKADLLREDIKIYNYAKGPSEYYYPESIEARCYD